MSIFRIVYFLIVINWKVYLTFLIEIEITNWILGNLNIQESFYVAYQC
jgi:hypothetical protein